MAAAVAAVHLVLHEAEQQRLREGVDERVHERERRVAQRVARKLRRDGCVEPCYPAPAASALWHMPCGRFVSCMQPMMHATVSFSPALVRLYCASHVMLACLVAESPQVQCSE